jgi:UDP-N-acetylglucosamine diphosphorylase/glucosamine-1-phosphate N-acetyltransferase
MKILLFDSGEVDLYPLSMTRPIGDLRSGILSARERWETLTGIEVLYGVRPMLRARFGFSSFPDEPVLCINARLEPNKIVFQEILNLAPGEAISYGDDLIAWHCERLGSLEEVYGFNGKYARQLSEKMVWLKYPHELFNRCAQRIDFDFELLCLNRKSAALHDSNKLIGDPKKLFIEPGASVLGAVINTNGGPVYIGKDAEVMEGSLIRGPLSLGMGACLKMGAKIYGATSIGRFSKVGGEVSNSVIQDFSNKAHDGFLGNSVLGSWCNLGADTNTSNLKNNYSTVKLWNFREHRFEDSGLVFCGLIMGDHGKTSINTMFNTGTITGVHCNVFGEGFPPKYIPSFSWGGRDDSPAFDREKAAEVARRMYARRNMEFTEEDYAILSALFLQTRQGVE